MTIPNVILDQFITVPWGNAVADSINKGLHGGQAITEWATTPAGTVVNELQWSSTHQAMMRWTGTQWRFADTYPAYMVRDDLYESSGGVAVFTSVSTGTFARLGDQVNHPGQWQLSSSVTANSGTLVSIGGANSLSTQAGLRCRFTIQPVIFGANTMTRVGFHDATTSVDATDGAYLEINAGVATFKTSQSSTRTSNVTTWTAAGGWYTVHIWFTTATAARCIVIDEAGVVKLDVTNTANTPGGTQRFGCACIATFAGTAATDVTGIDFIGFGFAPI